MTAPAGALPVFPHCRCSECSPQERYPYFLTAPAVSAPAGALPKFPHCRSSARSSRSLSLRPLPFTPPPPLFPHCRSSARSSRSLQQKPLLPPRCRSIITNGVQHPISPKAMQFLGGLLVIIWLLSHDKHFLGSFWVRAKCRARTPLPGQGEYPGLGNYYRARSPLLGQHAKYAYHLFSSLLSKCELVK